MAKRRTAHAGPRELIGEKIAERKGHRPKVEEMLIHLMLRDEAVARGLLGQISPEDFTDPLLRRAVKRIFDVLAAGKALDVRTINIEEDEELGRLITYYSVRELDWECESEPSKKEETKNTNVNDCVHLLKQQDPEKKMKLLNKAIQEAEARGDQDAVMRLIEEQNNLGRRPDRHHGKRVPSM
jgi:predicted RNA-binding protein with RPS1 domain